MRAMTQCRGLLTGWAGGKYHPLLFTGPAIEASMIERMELHLKMGS